MPCGPPAVACGWGACWSWPTKSPRLRWRGGSPLAWRASLVVVTCVLTQTTTHAVADLPERVAEAGFEQVEVERPGAGLAIVSARKAAA